MTENVSTQDKGLKPESEQEFSKVLFKHEMMKALIFNGCLAVIGISMILVNFIIDNIFEVDAFPIVILLLLMLITTIENIYIRVGNVIGGHKFYKAWLIYPLSNITVISVIVVFLNMKYPDAFTFDNSGFFIICLMGSMVFIHTAFIIRRGEPEHFQLALKSQDYDEKKVYMPKKKLWAYRLAFGSLSLISMFLLRFFFS